MGVTGLSLTVAKLLLDLTCSCWNVVEVCEDVMLTAVMLTADDSEGRGGSDMLDSFKSTTAADCGLF